MAENQPETHLIAFKNVSDGPRGVNGVNGTVMIEKGRSAKVEVTEGEALSAQGTGYFEMTDPHDPLDHDSNGEKGGSEPDEPVSLSGKNKAELLAIAADEGVEIEDGATNAEITAAIEAARAE